MTDRRFRLLFVCTGNTCRSPLAERIARREAGRRGWADEVDIRSAGIAAVPGQEASEGSLRVGEEEGLDLSDHRADLLTGELARGVDLILGMSRSHVHRAAELGADVPVALLGDFAEDRPGEGPDVPDPWGGPVERYRETFRALEALVTRALDRLPLPQDAGDPA
ncbi:MAG TPA: low molecular weight protein arginine phosphatase [Longimicrobiales bacterium]|nr:low molecular weight protein arginine phosphatase [Longimicrobiales bacterium]